MEDDALTMLGLALRAGSLAVGEEPVTEACHTGHARVVLLAADAADNTVDRAARLVGDRDVPLVILPYEKSRVGFHLGRGSCALLAVTDAGLAAAVMSKLAAAGPEYSETAALLKERAGRALRRKRRKAAARKSKQTQPRRWPV